MNYALSLKWTHELIYWFMFRYHCLRSVKLGVFQKDLWTGISPKRRPELTERNWQHLPHIETSAFYWLYCVLQALNDFGRKCQTQNHVWAVNPWNYRQVCASKNILCVCEWVKESEAKALTCVINLYRTLKASVQVHAVDNHLVKWLYFYFLRKIHDQLACFLNQIRFKRQWDKYQHGRFVFVAMSYINVDVCSWLTDLLTSLVVECEYGCSPKVLSG